MTCGAARGIAVVVLGALVLAAPGSIGCATSGAGSRAVAHERGPRIEDAFDGEPELLVVVRPTKLSRDPLYGPLLRRVSQLASSHAAVAAAVGTTALAALERADEVILASYDAKAHDALVAVRGVPAEIDPAHVVDTNGAPLWEHTRDLPRGVEELAASDHAAYAVLFVLPARAWVIAVGPAVARTRAAFVEDRHGVGSPLGAVDPDPLVVARLRGDALARMRPQLADGPLAPVTRDLDSATLTLEPGPQGQVGEVVARFVYGDAPFAVRAESPIRDVLAAFTRAYDAQAPWLHAVTVARDDRVVAVRGRIPRAWVDGFLHLEL
jgi:hypothetical protein